MPSESTDGCEGRQQLTDLRRSRMLSIHYLGKFSLHNNHNDFCSNNPVNLSTWRGRRLVQIQATGDWVRQERTERTWLSTIEHVACRCCDTILWTCLKEMLCQKKSVWIERFHTLYLYFIVFLPKQVISWLHDVRRKRCRFYIQSLFRVPFPLRFESRR